MAGHPMMRTPDGVWSVEVMTGRTGRQSFRVKRLDLVMPTGSGWTPTGRIVATIAEVRDIMGVDAFGQLREDRTRQRMDGGR